jgi:uncharacterized membrane-anchored protein
LTFWLINVAATTLGETAGAAVTLSMKLGYVSGTAMFAALFVFAVRAQISSRRLHVLLYWATIVAVANLGTTFAELLDHTAGLGDIRGNCLSLLCVLATLSIWRQALGRVNVLSIRTVGTEGFYWTTILFCQTLGSTLGNWTAGDEGLGLGYPTATLTFAVAPAVVAGVCLLTNASRTLLFWTAFVLTRPLGPIVGAWLGGPHARGGMELSRYSASAVLVILILAFIAVDSVRRLRSAGNTQSG